MLSKNKLIRIHPKDNVAVVSTEEGLEKQLPIADNLVTREKIPFCQKVALVTIPKNHPIIRYGVPIGYATCDIQAGEYVAKEKIFIRSNPPLTPELVQQTPLEIHYRFENQMAPTKYFWGYDNGDGTAGTRNILAINITVQCVKGVVDKAIEKIKAELLPKYPNVDDVVQINHIYGCGVAIQAKESAIPQRIIENIANNPNFGNEKLVVSLGCEKYIPEQAFKVTSEMNPDQLVILQNCHGFQEMIEEIYHKADCMLERLNRRQRTKLPLSLLTVGLQCGGSDAFSGMTANPSIGYAADLLVQQGAKVMFSEVTEVRDAYDIMLRRIEDPAVRQKLIDEFNWYDRYLEAGNVDRSANPSPGNKKGGLSTVIEKAMGSVAKSGTAAIVDVLSPGERIKLPGLTFAATPASDFVCGTCQLASGMTLEVFATGRGTPYNLQMAPVIKVATNPILYDKWSDILDFNAGEIISENLSIEEAGQKLFQLIIDVASGHKQTGSDHYGLYNDLAIFNPAQIT